MKIVIDTNWLVAAYFVKASQPRSEIVARFTERCDAPWIVPAPALLEARNVFSGYAHRVNGPEWQLLQTHLGRQIVVAPFSWDELAKKAEELADRFGAKARIGTIDLLIIAAALKAEATHFLSFDTNSNARALAAVLKLKVFPELTAADKQRVATLR